MSKEEQAEQEKMRLDAIKQAEKERRDKYKKQEDERENLRQGIRDKVTEYFFLLPGLLPPVIPSFTLFFLCLD